MTEFWIFMLIMVLLLPLTMVGFGFYFSKKAPKKINPFFGYRTSRSMKNKETWEFAHHYCGRLWKKIGLIMLPITIIAMLFIYGRNTDVVSIYGMIITLIQVAIMFGSIFPVESALKRKFENNMDI